VVCAFVFHNYVNLGVGLKLTLGQEVRILSGWPASHLAANLTSPSLSNFGKVDLRVGILPGSKRYSQVSETLRKQNIRIEIQGILGIT